VTGTVGVDIVDISRVRKVLEKWGDRFRNRVFTPGEIRYCEGKRFPAGHYAARFAAKEAFFKSAGGRLQGGWRYRDIDVAAGPGGRPVVRVGGRVAEALNSGEPLRWDVSLTHEKGYAVAVVLFGRHVPGDFPP